MTVATIQSGIFIRMAGTIAEVLEEMKDQRITKATQVLYWSDDNTDAVAVCRRFV